MCAEILSKTVGSVDILPFTLFLYCQWFNYIINTLHHIPANVSVVGSMMPLCLPNFYELYLESLHESVLKMSHHFM
jgi:hypothetical protein